MWRGLRFLRPIGWAVLAVTLSQPTLRFGVEPVRATSSGPMTPAPFKLKVDENQLSLKAAEASVKAILEAIGHQMQLDMVVRLRADWNVTVTFSALTLPDALKRLGVSAATIVAEDRPGGTAVTKILILDQGVATVPPSERLDRLAADRAERRVEEDATRERASVPLKIGAPLRFVVDPSQALRKP